MTSGHCHPFLTGKRCLHTLSSPGYPERFRSGLSGSLPPPSCDPPYRRKDAPLWLQKEPFPPRPHTGSDHRLFPVSWSHSHSPGRSHFRKRSPPAPRLPFFPPDIPGSLFSIQSPGTFPWNYMQAPGFPIRRPLPGRKGFPLRVLRPSSPRKTPGSSLWIPPG